VFYGRKQDKDPNTDRKEMRKLKREHKKEMRGAIREVRKDAKFVAGVRLKAKEDFDAERGTTVKRLENEMANEQGRFNTEDRKKMNKKDKRKKASAR